MDSTTEPPGAIRWFVAFTVVVVCVVLAKGILAGSPTHAALVQTFSLLGVGLAAYSWVLFPVGGSVTISALVLLCLLWAWAVRQSALLGWELAILVVLVGVAAMQRRRRQRRFLRMRQLLEDLGEEQTVKGQAMTLASQANETLQKKLSRYQQLQLIAEELSNMTDLGSIAKLAVERAFGLIGKSEACLLFLVDQERQELSLFASKKRENVSTIRAKHGDQFDRYVLRTHRPLLVNDVRRDFRFTVGLATDRPIGSVIACPLLLGQSPEGVLRLDSAQHGVYTQDDLRFLDILLDLVATGMVNAKLFAQTQQLAMTDGLTGLTLRRPFLEQLSRELTRAGRGREPVSVLMLDIDRFKDLNDSQGHVAGDHVLKTLAGLLRDVVPPGGVIARYGGEEFAVLLPRLARSQASDVGEAIRRTVEQQLRGGTSDVGARGSGARAAGAAPGGGRGAASTVATPAQVRRGGPVPGVTVSVGVATFPDDARMELELIRVADQRLYAAKRAGRNLVVCS